MTKRICENFEKEKGEKYCKNHLGFIIVKVHGEEKEIIESCANRCSKRPVIKTKRTSRINNN